MCRVVLPDKVEALEHREPPGDAVPGGPFMAVREAVSRDGVYGYGSAWHPAALPAAWCTGPAMLSGIARSIRRTRTSPDTSPRHMASTLASVHRTRAIWVRSVVHGRPFDASRGPKFAATLKDTSIKPFGRIKLAG